MKISSNNKPDKPKIRVSAGAKKAEERYDKMGTPEEKRERYYKVKVKATDPGARAGKASSVKVKQITKEKADKLKDKQVRRDADNPGQLAQTIKKETGASEVQRYKATKISSGKSNLTVGGKITKALGGNPSQHQEKATSGKHSYVAVKPAKPDEIKTIKPKSPTPPVKNPDLPRMPVVPDKMTGEKEEIPLNGGGQRVKKGISSKGNVVIKANNLPFKSTATKKYKYTVTLANGTKKEVDKDDPRFKKLFE